MQWIKQEKSMKRIDIPSVRIREKGIALNVPMCKEYAISTGMECEVYLSGDKKSIAFKFMDSQTNDSYAVTKDGGSGGGGLFIACGKFVSKINVSKDQKNKPITVLHDIDSGYVYFNVMPAFDRRLSITKPLVSETGVYRYIYDDEVVYIGQGVLRSRFSEKIRESWNYDDVEYMVIESEDERFNIEKKLLDEHKQVNGKLPFYNRVGGRNVR